MELLTSHVGSFPLDPFEDAEEAILKDLHSIGLDVPPYPQLRSFIDIYLEPLAKAGLITKKGDFYFANPKELLESRPPNIRIPEAEKAIDVVNRRKLRFKKLRAPITGPFTLASRVYFDDPEKGLRATMISKPDVVSSFFKEYVIKSVEVMANLGYGFIVIDEPILGIIVGKRRILYGHTADSIIQLFEEIYKHKADADGGIHVCGRISGKLFDVLVQVTRLNVLNFEFKDTPENIESINAELLEQYDKYLAPGIASAKKPIIEDYNDVLNLFTKIYNYVKGRVNYISADCGFGGLKGSVSDPWKAYRIGLKKLETIVKVVRNFKH